MEIVVTGRNSEISDRFREHVLEKLHRIDKYDQRQKILRVEVEVTHEKNHRQHEKAARVEMTLLSRGPAVRAEASSTDQHSALDAAIDKLESRDCAASPTVAASVTVSTSPRRSPRRPPTSRDGLLVPGPEENGVPTHYVGGMEVQGEDSPLVVREKTHAGAPMTLDQALHEMELVGHDFFLFMEKDSMRPSVVYLRKGYDYGVIHLDVKE